MYRINWKIKLPSQVYLHPFHSIMGLEKLYTMAIQKSYHQQVLESTLLKLTGQPQRKENGETTGFGSEPIMVISGIFFFSSLTIFQVL